jgi:hypothetical protein
MVEVVDVLHNHKRSAPAADTALLQEYAGALQQLAWYGYTWCGRGLIVVSMQQFNEVSFTYLSYGHISTIGDSADVREMKRYVRRYQPAREVVCAVLTPDDKVHVYHVRLPSAALAAPSLQRPLVA